MFETTNSTTQGLLHFVETTNSRTQGFEFGKFAYTANTQLIWSSGIPFVVAVNLI
jgi:hypothetical protein